MFIFLLPSIIANVTINLLFYATINVITNVPLFQLIRILWLKNRISWGILNTRLLVRSAWTWCMPAITIIAAPSGTPRRVIIHDNRGRGRQLACKARQNFVPGGNINKERSYSCEQDLSLSTWLCLCDYLEFLKWVIKSVTVLSAAKASSSLSFLYLSAFKSSKVLKRLKLTGSYQ